MRILSGLEVWLMRVLYANTTFCEDLKMLEVLWNIK